MSKIVKRFKREHMDISTVIDGGKAMTREEAIKELKALESRSCDGCKYNKEIDGFMVFCDKMMWHSFTKDFCCKYWEAK